MRNFRLPSKKEINFIFASFSKKEWIFFFGFFAVLIVSTVIILQNINRSFMVNVPLRGGSLSVGIVGVPRFINPILASGEADTDLTSFIYSGLLRKSEDGSLKPDLAEKYDMSKDGLTYTFTLKNNIYFQDGEPVTADDVLYTINKVKDSIIKSPHKADWDGVSVEKIDDKNVKFTLKQPYALFLENTTIGILPQHVWGDSPLELNNANTNPVGSGPYMIDNVTKESSGVIDSVALVPFEKFALGEPYIKNIKITFYQNEDDLVNALLNKEVDEIGSITPLNAENLKERNFQIDSTVLPRIFGLFFNQNANLIFTDKAVVRAINEAIDKDHLVRDVLFGYGVVINGPIPPSVLPQTTLPTPSREEVIAKVKSDLDKAGWKENAEGVREKTTTDNKKKKTTTPLAFSISTGNAPDLTKAAEFIKEDLANVGIQVDIKTFETGNLNQNVIRPRKYDALLFGEIINNESDLFAFWHSSQRKDPGLNVAMYTNAKVDKILEDAFTTIDQDARIKKYTQFSDEVKKDMGAIFLYSPNFIYIASRDIKEPKMEQITSPSDRYLNVNSWYSETQSVWKIFTK